MIYCLVQMLQNNATAALVSSKDRAVLERVEGRNDPNPQLPQTQNGATS